VNTATRFCMEVSNISGSPAWNLLHITLVAPRISRWLLEFGKICASLADDIYINFNLNYCSSQTIFINGAVSMLSYLEHTYISSLKALYIKKISKICLIKLHIHRQMGATKLMSSTNYYQEYIKEQ